MNFCFSTSSGSIYTIENGTIQGGKRLPKAVAFVDYQPVMVGSRASFSLADGSVLVTSTVTKIMGH